MFEMQTQRLREDIEIEGKDRVDVDRQLRKYLDVDIPKLHVQLEATAIPALPGSIELLKAGHASSLSPANRRAWDLLDPEPEQTTPSAVTLNLGLINKGSFQHKAVLELLVDPQTCGPLLISVTETLSKALLKEDSKAWWPIGRALSN